MQMQNLPVCIEACALWLGPATSREEDHAKLLQNGSPSERGAGAPKDDYSASKSWATGTFSLLHMWRHTNSNHHLEKLSPNC